MEMEGRGGAGLRGMDGEGEYWLCLRVGTHVGAGLENWFEFYVSLTDT